MSGPDSYRAVLAMALRAYADQLTTLADRLETHAPDTLPPHRILTIASRLLAHCEDGEREGHRLAAWLGPAREPMA